MSDKLTVVEQKEVTFYDDELTAVRGDDEKIYVSIRRMCEALGVDRRGQMRRIRDHEVLVEGYRRGGLISPPGKKGGGGRQEAALLRVDLVPLWLSGISPNRVSEEIRPKLVRFLKEAANVLWEAFQEGRLTADPTFDELLNTDSDAAQAYKLGVAIMKLARNQMLMDARIDSHETRLEAIEAQLSAPDHALSQSQAMQVSQAVKAVAIAQGKETGRNEFGSVYGELYRKFEVTSYKLLPSAMFEEVMDWLTEWHATLTGDAPF